MLVLKDLHFAKIVGLRLQSEAHALQLRLSTDAQPSTPSTAAADEGNQRRFKTARNFVLSTMMHIKKLVHAALCEHHRLRHHDLDTDALSLMNPQSSGLPSHISAVVQKLIQGGHLPASFSMPSQEDVDSFERLHQVQEDTEVADAMHCCHQLLETDSRIHFDPALLATAIRSMNAVAEGLELQACLAVEIATLSKNGDYTDDNFAYGTTPFSSWLKVMKQDAVHAAMLAQNGTYMVWGSSLGWLLMYAAVVYGIECVGYELLGTLCQECVKVAERLGVQNVWVHAADLLESSLEGVVVLVLTNQCWDEELMDRCAAKVKDELPQGAVCIEYTGRLQPVLGQPYSRVRCPVSWNPHQEIYTFIKQ